MDSPALTSAHLSSSGKGRHSNLNDRGRVKRKVERSWMAAQRSTLGPRTAGTSVTCVEKLLSIIKEAIKTPSHLVK